MLAWTIDPHSTGGVKLQHVAEPVPGPHEAVVQVEAFAPNPGDISALPAMTPGTIPGWDGSGTVIRAAADGSGPRAGERVVFLGVAGGWAQRRSVSLSMMARTDGDLSWERLAALPVPAASALRALRRLGSILGRRVLITGATSAVGRMAVQLAARSGADVVAVARDRAQHDVLRGLGAAETHTDLATVGTRVHGAIDLIGGQWLVDAYSLLHPGGTVIALGHAAGTEERFPYGAFVADEHTANRSITSFFLGAEPGLDAELGLVANEPVLDSGPIESRPWTDLAGWIAAGAGRPRGRVAFRVGHNSPE